MEFPPKLGPAPVPMFMNWPPNGGSCGRSEDIWNGEDIWKKFVTGGCSPRVYWPKYPDCPYPDCPYCPNK